MKEPLGVLLPLGEHQFGIAEFAHDGAHAFAQLRGCADAAVAIGRLEAAGRIRVRAHQHRHLLP